MPLASAQTRGWLRRKAPQLILVVILVALAAYFAFEILEDFFIEGAPLTSGPLIGAIVAFTHDVTASVKSLGYLGVFLLMLLESSSLPIPSEMVLPFAGYLVSTGHLNFWVTVVVSTVAGLAGSMVDYYIGLKGVHILAEHKILGRVFFNKNQLEIAARWFGRYGSIMVLLSRLVPGLRTLVSFPAGAVRMPIAKFLAFTAVGCFVWNGILIYVGVFLGENWRRVAGVSHYLVILVVAVLAVMFVGYLLWRRRRIKRSKTQSLAA
jgi:membrane protein DedA with SNARE-associated domain